MEPAATVRRHSIFYATGTRVSRKRGYAAYWQKCRAAPSSLARTLTFTSQDYRLRLQLQQVGCTVDYYQLKANALSGLSAEYIPMLNQLRTVQSLDFTMVNEMLREVYVNDILPNKVKNPLRGYRGEAAMTTTTTAKRSGKKRDISEVVCHNCKVKGCLLYTSPSPRD